MPVWNFVRSGVYEDSVTLMLISRDIEAIHGVHRAAAMMGTPANVALLRDADLLASDSEKATPNDLIIAINADDERVALEARGAADEALNARHIAATSAGRPRPRTIAMI